MQPPDADGHPIGGRADRQRLLDMRLNDLDRGGGALVIVEQVDV